MNDFSIPGVPNQFGFPPSLANFVRPGKRPLSSVTPVMAEHLNGTLFLVTGAAGGSRIISATAQAAWHVLERELSMAGAIQEPRLHDQLVPDLVAFERAFDNGTVASMADKGHNVEWMGPGSSAVQGVRRLWNGTFEAAGEVRQKNSGGLNI